MFFQGLGSKVLFARLIGQLFGFDNMTAVGSLSLPKKKGFHGAGCAGHQSTNLQVQGLEVRPGTTGLQLFGFSWMLVGKCLLRETYKLLRCVRVSVVERGHMLACSLHKHSRYFGLISLLKKSFLWYL